MYLDDTAVAEVAELLRELLDEIAGIQAEARKRGGSVPCEAVLMGFAPGGR